MTKMQKAILDMVVNSRGHFTAEEVHRLIKEKFPSAALGTIYRNLSLFADQKLLRRVSRADAPDCFEGNIQPHDHSVCVRCGKMTDLHIHGLKDFLKQKMNCDIISFDLTVNCECEQCVQQQKPNGDK